MVSIYKVVSFNSKYLLEFVGLSGDEKPIKKFGRQLIMNGSKFLEIDTGKTYRYDEENQVWHQIVTAAGSGGSNSNNGSSGDGSSGDGFIYDGGGVSG